MADHSSSKSISGGSARFVERLRSAHAISTTMTSLHTLRSVIEYTVRSMRRDLGYDHVSIALVDGDILTFMASAYAYNNRFQGAWDQKTPLQISIGEHVTGWVAQHGKSALISDVSKDPRYSQWDLGRLPASFVIRSELAFPLKQYDRIIGVLNVESTVLDGFCEEDQLILELLAEQLTAAIENTRLLEQNRDQIAAYIRYRDMFNALPIGLFRTRPNGQILESNDAVRRILGFPDQTTLLQTQVTDHYVNPADRQELLDLLGQKGMARDFEIKARRYDGSQIWVKTNIQIIYDDQGQMLYHDGTVEDITEMKLADEALEFEDRMQKAENVVRFRVIFMEEPEDICQVISEISTQVRQAGVAHDSCSIQIVNPAGTDFISLGPKFVEAYRDKIIGNDWGALTNNAQEYPWVIEVWRSGRPRYDPCVSRTIGQRTGRPVINVPFSHGTLAINTLASHTFSEWDIKILQRFAGVLSEGFQRFRDIIQRRRMEESLQVSETRLRRALDGGKLGVWEWNLETDQVTRDGAYARMYGIPESDFNGPLGLLAHFLHPEDRAGMEAHFRLARLTGEFGYFEVRIIRPDDVVRWLAIQGRSAAGTVGLPKYIHGIVQDITDRKEAMDRLTGYRDQLRSLALQLTRSEEATRRQIANGLHDQIGQTLAAMKLSLSTLATESDSDSMKQSLQKMNNEFTQIIKDTRDLTLELSPPILYELGFSATVDWLAEHHWKKNRIAYTIENDAREIPLTDDLSTILFTTVRELISNVVKHASAERASVVITGGADQIRITISDDGNGFDPHTRTHGFGLFSIHERLRHIGGAMQIASELKKGTQITVVAPLQILRPAETPSDQPPG